MTGKLGFSYKTVNGMEACTTRKQNIEVSADTIKKLQNRKRYGGMHDYIGNTGKARILESKFQNRKRYGGMHDAALKNDDLTKYLAKVSKP